MGACIGHATDTFKKLVQEEGEKFAKKVAIEKGKKVIIEKFAEFIQKANSHFDEYI